MCIPLTAPADVTVADIFKMDKSKAKHEKQKRAFTGTPVKAPADLTGADILKVNTSKAKREIKEMGSHGYPPKSPRRPYWGRHFQSGYKQS